MNDATKKPAVTMLKSDLRKSDPSSRAWNVQIVTQTVRSTRVHSYQVDERMVLSIARDLAKKHSRVLKIAARDTTGEVWALRSM